ncbi:hypothetical protein MW887_002621 [Aspergillus wentii]|nr:hypothetical protein MW887_002621 [Aspergillus wentii]
MTTPDALRDAEYIADVSGLPYGGVAGLAGSQYNSPSGQDERIKKVQSTAKIAFIDRLLRDLDILVYCELSALYYMDCSIILFAVRAIVQLIFFTPKAPPFDPTRNQPFIGAIFAKVDEATRGYLHGGLFIDFIGQKAPVSVFRLLSLDLLVLTLDFIMLGLIIERVKTAGVTAAPSTVTNTLETNTQQDHDSEERGVLRDSPQSNSTGSANDVIELDEFGSRDSQAYASASTDDQLERTGLLADPSEDGHARTKDSHVLDNFASGEAVIMDVGLIDVIKDQWGYSHANALRRTSPSYVPSDETATFLRQRFGLQVGTDGRVVRIQS